MKKWKDIAERTLWTAAEAGIAYLSTRLVDIDATWAVLIAPVLAVAKGWIATHIGDDSAALPSNAVG